jgi:hypothetical protein
VAGRYRLRYLFDFGSGVCLWSDNDAARDRFGYPVDLKALPLSETVRRRAFFVLAWFDTFMDWDNAPAPSRWQPLEVEPFKVAAQELLGLLRDQLGLDFEIIDESVTGP